SRIFPTGRDDCHARSCCEISRLGAKVGIRRATRNTTGLGGGHRCNQRSGKGDPNAKPAVDHECPPSSRREESTQDPRSQSQKTATTVNEFLTPASQTRRP